MGKRQVDPIFFEKWKQRFNTVSLSGDPDKEEQLYKLYDEIETDLTFIGCSAIEDKLQDNVPHAIKTIMDAGIRVWVLTGDKQGTAIEIAKSCNLIGKNNVIDIEIVILTIDSEEVDVNEFVKVLERESKKERKGKFGLVIDGKTLAKVIADEKLSE